jgi:hypothetical protein
MLGIIFLASFSAGHSENVTLAGLLAAHPTHRGRRRPRSHNLRERVVATNARLAAVAGLLSSGRFLYHGTPEAAGRSGGAVPKQVRHVPAALGLSVAVAERLPPW